MIRTGPDQWQSSVGGSTERGAQLSALRSSTGFAGAISCDIFGDALSPASEQAELDLRYSQRVAKSPLLAIVAETCRPIISLSVMMRPICTSHQNTYLKAGSKIYADGRISVASVRLVRIGEKLIASAQDQKARGVRSRMTRNFRKLMDQRYDTTLRTMCELADVIKVSDDDLLGHSVAAIYQTVSSAYATSIAMQSSWATRQCWCTLHVAQKSMPSGAA